MCISLMSQCTHSSYDSVLNGCNWMPASRSNGQPSHSCRIQPAKLYRLGATILLADRSILYLEHLLLNPLVRPLHERQERLKSRRPFVPAAQKL